MANQTTGTPALNPPPPGDPASLATTPQSVDRYDVVIGGTGFMLYRGEDDSPPDRVYKTEPVDSTYTPTFIDRTNVSGDLGDNVQDFFMTFVQRDWSSGIGQKYFRQQPDREASFYEGKNIQPTLVPGAVICGLTETTQALTGGAAKAMNMVFVKAVKAGSNSKQDILIKAECDSVSASLFFSLDGGATWNSYPITAWNNPKDLADVVAGDDNNVYWLEASTDGASLIRTHTALLGSSPGTITITSWTTLTPGGRCIEYFNGSVYVGCSDGTLRTFTSSGAAGTTIKDFGGGTIVDILVGGGKIWILYLSTRGRYKLYTYDGQSVSEVAQLPTGWKLGFAAEGQQTIINNSVTPSYSLNSSTINCLAYSDGVLYVSGMTPARDPGMSNAEQYPYRTSLWFYASGNSGLVFESETCSEHFSRGGGSACCVVRGGKIVFADLLSSRLLIYDPSTGGVAPIASVSQVGSVAMTAVLNATISNTTGSTMAFTAAGDATSLHIGAVITSRVTGEKALLSNRDASATFTLIRGWAGTTASASSWVNGNTVDFVCAQPPAHSIVYDPSAETINLIWGNNDNGFNASYPSYQIPGMNNRQTYFQLRPKVAAAGFICSSNFDFNSSLQKYFRTVTIDGDLKQTSRSDEQAGTFDIYVSLDGLTNTTVGATLVQANATPGTAYPINATGHSICVIVQLNPAATDASHPVSVGPVLRRIAVRGVPILPGYRKRNFELALFNELTLKDGGQEQNTPAQLAALLETMIQSNTPVSVSDNRMTNTSMVFNADECKFREMRPNEWVAYISMREV